MIIDKANPNEKEKIEFEHALQQRNFEIELFWKRSWFFGALILAEVAGLYTLKSNEGYFAPPVTLSFVICLTTLAQCLMNRGSKYWQERWEYMTMNREAAYKIELTSLRQKMKKDQQEAESNAEWYFIDASILSKDKNSLTLARRFSVSKITFLVWDIIFICAALVWLKESISLLSCTPDLKFTCFLVVFYFILCGYILFFWRGGKVYEPYTTNLTNRTSSELESLNETYIRNKFE
jgi:hypothetical protein